MKKIDPSLTNIKKTLCPFCSYGCEFGLVFDDFGVRGVEYLTEGKSNGRLCPRGSAAALYLNHPKRSTTPVKSRKAIEWSKILKELKRVIDKPDSVAVTFDRNITIEEYKSIISFCNTVGIKTVASTYFEPEALLSRFFDRTFTESEIDNAEMIIVVGDPFNQSPMISKSLINWKLRDWKNRLVVIDSINTHTSAFATDFLKVNPGTEPLLIFALTQENTAGIDVPAITGIQEARINDISSNIKSAGKGLILVSFSFAHTYDPQLLTESLGKLSDFSGKKVVSFVEFVGFNGSQDFGEVIDLIKKKKIKQLINFGELFPFFYPQLYKSLKAVNIYSTTPIKYNGYTTLPVAINIEKTGTILTTFGKKQLGGNIQPASGARTITDILTAIIDIQAKSEGLMIPKRKIDIKQRVDTLIKKCEPTKKRKSFKLFGEKIAFNFLGLLEDDAIKINPRDAERLGIRSNDKVSVKSRQGTAELVVKIKEDVDEGIALTPAESPETRGLFDFEIVDNIVNFVPTEVEIWRKG